MLEALAQAQPSNAVPPVISAAAEILKAGTLGAALIIVSWVAYQMWKENRDLQSKRVEEARAVATAQREIQEKATESIKAIMDQRVQEAKAANAERLSDAQAYASSLSQQNSQLIAALNSTSNALSDMKDTSSELRSAIERLNDNIRLPRRG